MGIKSMLARIWMFLVFVFSGIFNNIKKVCSIIAKNIRILIRSKSSALVVILGPLIIVSLIGLAFNNSNIYDVGIGVYSDKYSELSESIVKQLGDEQYNIKKAETRELCIEGIKKGDYDMCLVFSPDMAVENKKVNKITFYVDYTRVNLVYAIMDNIASKLAKTTNKLSLEMTQTLVSQLEATKDELAKKISSITALGANNRNMFSRLENIDSSLNNLNLTFNENDLKVDSILAQLNTARAVAGAQNKSTPEIEMAIAKTNDLQTKINWLVYNVKTSKEDIGKNTAEITSVKAILDNDKKSIDELKGSVSKVTAGIESINITTAENIVSPIQTEVQPIVTEQTYLGRLFPTFLVLVLMFVCIMLAVTLVLNEKNTNAYFRNFITPTYDSIFIIGTYLTCLLIVSVQVLIIMYVMKYFLNPVMMNSLYGCAIPLFLISSLFILIGMTIGYLFSSQETAILASLFVVSASLFFSNTILPLETVSIYVKWLVAINPFVLSEEALKKILIFGFSLKDISGLIVELVKFIAVMVVAVYVSLKYYKRKLNQ